MRFFPVFDFQMVVLLTFLGLVAFLLLCIAFGQNRREGEEKLENYAGEIKAANKPIPPILVFVYVAFVVWAIVYAVAIGIKGDPF
jgi:amino acid transporter